MERKETMGELLKPLSKENTSNASNSFQSLKAKDKERKRKTKTNTTETVGSSCM